jgi:hypothetical protein
MIDDQSDAGSWAAAMLATRPSLKVLTDIELHCPHLIAKVQQSHGLATMGDARDMVADEKKRRTEVTSWDGAR